MQSSEYLRRKKNAMPKVIAAPTPIDSSTYIFNKKLTAVNKCCPTKTVYPIVFPCTPEPPDIGTASPADSYLGIKPAVYYSNKCPAASGAPPQLMPPKTLYLVKGGPLVWCTCPSVGNQNTLWANNVPTILSPSEIPQGKQCTVCSGITTGCDENGFGC